MRQIKYRPDGFPRDNVIKRMLKQFVSLFYPPLGYLLVFLHKKYNKCRKKYQVTICAIFKNEAPFMKEWLDYYSLLGVEHFYLYNNFSDDDYLSIIHPYIEKGAVDLIEWPVKHGQMIAYRDCYERFACETEWLGYIDLDEFVCPRYEPSISGWLKKYNRYPSVLICWRQFGTSGIVEHDHSRLVIEQYTTAWEMPVDVGKSFINTQYNFMFRPNNMHYFYAIIKICGIKLLIPPVNEYKKFVWFWKHHYPFFHHNPTIQINHYYSKSYNHYIYKYEKKGSANSAVAEENKKSKGLFEYHELRNITKDYTIQRFLALLKQR
jgi:hypothetical protein